MLRFRFYFVAELNGKVGERIIRFAEAIKPAFESFLNRLLQLESPGHLFEDLDVCHRCSRFPILFGDPQHGQSFRMSHVEGVLHGRHG